MTRLEAEAQEWLRVNYQPDPSARDAAHAAFRAGAAWMREQAAQFVADTRVESRGLFRTDQIPMDPIAERIRQLGTEEEETPDA